MIARRHWVSALSLALVLHLAGFVLVLAPSAKEGARDVGEKGLEIDLGMLGDLGEAQESVEEAVPEPPPPEPEPDASTPEAVPEPEVEAMPEPEPEPVKQEAPLKVEKRAQPEAKPQPKLQPEPKPEARPEPRPVPAKSDTTQEVANAEQRKMSTGTANAVTAGGNPAARRSYFAQLAAKLARYKRYPISSRRRGEEGVVRLAFELNRRGEVLGFHIAESSGSTRLDEAVLDMLKKAQPLPAFPEEMKQDSLSITIPVEFSLQNK